VSDEKVPDIIKNPPVTSDAQGAVEALLREKVSKPDIKTPEAHATISAVAGKELTDVEASEMINRMSGPQLLELARRIEAVKTEADSKKVEAKKPRYYTESEFSNVQEKDIYDFSVPIAVIDHQLPDFLDIKLKDPNYVPRWINMDARRMGQVIAEGWSYISEEDLAEPLKVEIGDSADGHYVYDDVVAMKLTKEKVYGRIRGNFIKSLSLTKSTLALHEHMKNLIKAELASGPEGDRYQKYNEDNKMGVYSPLAGA
jgi:hypothetical protein